MPRSPFYTPAYRLHKQSGQAIVTLSGKDVLLGPFGTPASRQEYDRRIAEWLANGRQLRAEEETTVVETINAYRKFAESYYQKNGQVTREYGCIKEALAVVRNLYGRTHANDFGPLALKAVRQRMIDAGWSRSYINKSIGRVRRCFKWAVENELIRSDIYYGLMDVSGLRQGRSEAREPDPVMPVPDATVHATLRHLSSVVADMIRVQRLTGCRPEDVCNLRPCDVDNSSDIWLYRPASHKTQHHGRHRIVAIGPKGQNVLRPYLLRDKAAYCFAPSESETKRRQLQQENRQTSLRYGNRPGSNRKRTPKRTAGDRYTTASYRRAIHRACDKAFPPTELPMRQTGASKKEWKARLSAEQLLKLKRWQKQHRWSPNQMRHTAGTEIRKRFGLEAAQVTLGQPSRDLFGDSARRFRHELPRRFGENPWKR